MSEQENMRIVREATEALNRHDLNAYDRLMSDSLQTEAAGAPGKMNKQQNHMYVQQFVQAFPDLHFDIEDLFGQGDHVALTWMVKGTHKNPLATPTGASIPATNRTFSIPGSTIFEVRNNSITHQKIYWDMVTLLTQLGVVTEQDLTSRAR
jgi:steroid delta-isomerase-like uncharacterized protein